MGEVHRGLLLFRPLHRHGIRQGPDRAARKSPGHRAQDAGPCGELVLGSSRMAGGVIPFHGNAAVAHDVSC